MSEKSSQTQEAQGADLENLPVPDLATIQKWLSDDLGRARSLLQCIHDNPNIRRLIAEHLLGQVQNFHNAKKAEPIN